MVHLEVHANTLAQAKAMLCDETTAPLPPSSACDYPSACPPESAPMEAMAWPSVGTLDSEDSLGRVKRRIIQTKYVLSRRKAVGLAAARDEFSQLTDDDLLGALHTVAASKGISITAIGDGAFLQFLIDNWEEILKIILMLIGL